MPNAFDHDMSNELPGSELLKWSDSRQGDEKYVPVIDPELAEWRASKRKDRAYSGLDRLIRFFGGPLFPSALIVAANLLIEKEHYSQGTGGILCGSAKDVQAQVRAVATLWGIVRSMPTLDEVVEREGGRVRSSSGLTAEAMREEALDAQLLEEAMSARNNIEADKKPKFTVTNTKHLSSRRQSAASNPVVSLPGLPPAPSNFAAQVHAAFFSPPRELSVFELTRITASV